MIITLSVQSGKFRLESQQISLRGTKRPLFSFRSGMSRRDDSHATADFAVTGRCGNISTMRTIFAILAGLSALICFALIGITVATLGRAKVMKIREDSLHNYEIKFDGLAMAYEGRLKPVAFGPKGFKTTTSDSMGIKTDHQTVAADPENNVSASEGKLTEIPSLYPIALFGILPLAWVVSKIGGKKKTLPADTTTSPAA